MRYLTRSFTLGALRRGKEVEQFLGPVEVNGVAGVRWVAVWPWEGAFRVALHTAEDLDDGDLRDLDSLPPLEPAGEEREERYRLLGSHDDPGAAVELAERLAGAVPQRWVNFGVAGEEYADLVRSRRRQP